MAQRPKGCQSARMLADGYVGGDGFNPKNVYALVICASGATVGDIVVLRNGSELGTVLFEFIVPAANGIWSIELGRYGVEFAQNIYYSELATAPNKIVTTVVFG